MNEGGVWGLEKRGWLLVSCWANPFSYPSLGVGCAGGPTVTRKALAVGQRPFQGRKLRVPHLFNLRRSNGAGARPPTEYPTVFRNTKLAQKYVIEIFNRVMFCVFFFEKSDVIKILSQRLSLMPYITENIATAGQSY